MVTASRLVARWTEPPASVLGRPRKGRKWPWAELAQELRARSGEWAELVEEVPIRIAHEINQGMLAPFRPIGTFEAVTRNGVVYVRHLGADGGQA